MGVITFNIKSKVDTHQVFSAKDIKDMFLTGLPLDKLNLISDDVYDFYINSAIEFIENQLCLKLNKQIITENKDFFLDDWQQWNYVKTTYPAVLALSLQGFLGTTKQVDYPKGWLSCRKTSDGVLYSRNIYMVPTQNSTQSELIVYSGIMPNAGFFTGHRQIPNYWNIKYITGFDKIPANILQAIGMVASIPLLGIISDMLIRGNKNMGGLGYGVSSKSISLDGLSQSVSTYANGQTGLFGARIKQMSEQLGIRGEQGLLQQLIDYYGSFIWGVA